MEPRGYWSVRISPDGGSVLLNASDVWLFDVERKTSRRQTFEGAEGNAIWGPEPDRFSFIANREGISALYSKGINSGPGDLQRLPSEPGEFSASSWSSDGKRLAFVGSSGEDVWVLDAEGHAELFLGTQFIHNYPEFSPDDRWIVHTSNESGRAEVYVRPYPGPGPSVQISRGGGSHPAWSRDGREIFYRWPSEAGHKFFAVSIDSSGDRLTAGEPIELFDGNAYLAMSPVRPYDVAPDGRFLFIKWPDEAAQSAAVDKVFPDRIRVVQNWFDELRAKMGTNR